MSRQMEANSFFAEAPKAECAFLSAYKCDELKGKYGIRIEVEPLAFADTDLPGELEPEIILDHLALPSIVPMELQNTRFIPNSDQSPRFRYEGSFYFLGEHNQVDLREIRFLEATEDAIVAEYHLVVHLPTRPPKEYPVVLTTRTRIDSGIIVLKPSRQVEGLGTLVQSEENLWQCQGIYDGNSVRIELSAESTSFERIATYATAVIAENAITPSDIRNEIKEWLGILKWKFDEFNVKPDFNPADFIPRSFYFYQRRYHKEPEVIIVLDHPSDIGHWSLSFTGTRGGDLNWVPR
jgi:hypothetical protein